MKKINKNTIYIITSLLILLLVLILDKTNISNLKNQILGDVSKNNSGYTCNQFSGTCEYDRKNAQYSTKETCENNCFKYQWYCNKTLGQCTKDFRGKYNNLVDCWKNCFDKVTYTCNNDGSCTPINVYGDSYIDYDKICTKGPIQCKSKQINSFLTLDECIQECPGNINIKYSQKNHECIPDKNGSYYSLKDCISDIKNPYTGYTGYNCNASKNCVLTTDFNPNFKASTFEDAFDKCKKACSIIN